MGNKKVIVTGGSKGIGSGIVRKLAGLGYDVVFSYGRHSADAFALRDEMRGTHGVRCECYQAMLHVPGEGKAFFERAVEYLGGLDLLVNNAGVTFLESILELTEEKLDHLLNLDFRNYCIMMREASRYMAKHGIKGAIVNITSSRAERSYPGDGIYGAIKAGLNRAIESFALDVAPYGIRINNVAPGAICVRSREEIAEMNGKISEDFWDKLGNVIPLERTGVPEDVARAVAFLASEDASYITGITLRVDGGLILPGMPEKRPSDCADRGWGYVKKEIVD